MRASFSKRSGLEPAEAVQDSGYSICIAFMPLKYALSARNQRKFACACPLRLCAFALNDGPLGFREFVH